MRRSRGTKAIPAGPEEPLAGLLGLPTLGVQAQPKAHQPKERRQKMSEENLNTDAASGASHGITGNQDDTDSGARRLAQDEDLAHGGDPKKAEELEKKAYGDTENNGDGETPHVQFPG
jgi:hypothetical protein